MINSRPQLKDLTAYVPGKPVADVQRELGLAQVIKLASNENPLGCSPAATQAMANSLQETAIYPDGHVTALRHKLSCLLDLPTDHLVFGAGSDEIISFIANAYITPGDEAITCVPTFPRYTASVRLIGGKMIELPLTADHRYDLSAILEAITDKTKVIFMANPNNPTGTIITQSEQLNFLKQIPSHVLVVLDEAYHDYIDDPAYPDSLALLKDYDNLILLRTFSKIYGLAALRIGYGVAKPNVIANLNLTRGPFNVNSLAQVAATAAVDDTDFVNRSKHLNHEVKNWVMKECDRLGYPYIPSYGNFLMIDFKVDSLALFDKLLHRGYIVRPGFYFGMPTYQRVSIGTAEQMEGFFNVLQEVID